MNPNERSLDKIASAMDRISRNGITVNLRFPAETDKFALDLAAMKISEGLTAIANAISEVLFHESEDRAD